MAMAAFASASPALSRRQPGWIYKPSWDLPLIIFSALLVPMPFLAAWGAQISGWLSPKQAIDAINITVAALIGGPHLFSTVTFTFLDGGFRSRHPWYAGMAVLLPVSVIYLGIYHYIFLVTFFFSWASLHVLHQIIYLTDCYRTRGAVREPRWSRMVDYGLILTGLYPIGIYKLSLRQFHVGGILLPYPDWLRALPLPAVAGVVFGAFLVAWLGKTAIEIREGRVSVPKTLLISITTLVSFCLPMGSNLDVLFQGYNTWHSFQYLFLLWLINRLRLERGEIEAGFVRRLVGGGMPLYYGCFLAATGVMVLVTLAVRSATSLSADRSYFVVVLSVLLVHYYFDHFLFTHPQMVE